MANKYLCIVLLSFLVIPTALAEEDDSTSVKMTTCRLASQILGNNECFEPITSNIYSRKTLAGEFIMINKYLVSELIELELWNEDIKNNIIANKIFVGQAYPNPFNSGIRMDYYIDPKIGDIDMTIDILDLNGRRIQTLIKNRVTSGFHTVFWTSNNNATGIYFIQLSAGDFISTQKIVHLK